MVYKTCPGIILTSVRNQYWLVSPKNRIEMNETAAFFWTQLTKGTTVQNLKKAAMEEYEIDDVDLEQEINEFIEDLLKGRWIEQIPENNG